VFKQNLLVANYSNVVGGTNTSIISGTCNYPIDTPLYWTNGITPNTATRQLTAPLSNVTRFFTRITINCNSLYTPASASVPSFTLYTQLCNLHATASLSCNMPLYFDARSQILVQTVINSVTGSGGLRMESGSNISDPGTNLIYLSPNSYNNNSNINSTPATLYNFELPIVNGLFRSASNLGLAYQNIASYQMPDMDYTNLSG
jgi:hypothetical protein